MAAKPVPDGYRTVTPYLGVDGAPGLIEFMKQVFGAEETFRMAMPDGTVGHAEVRIGDSMIMVGDAGECKPMLHLYVDDIDAAYKRALQAGATTVREPADQTHGDRNAQVKDQFGNIWFISTHIRDNAG